MGLAWLAEVEMTREMCTRTLSRGRMSFFSSWRRKAAFPLVNSHSTLVNSITSHWLKIQFNICSFLRCHTRPDLCDKTIETAANTCCRRFARSGHFRRRTAKAICGVTRLFQVPSGTSIAKHPSRHKVSWTSWKQYVRGLKKVKQERAWNEHKFFAVLVY